MSLIGWNCRNIGSPSAIPDLYLVRHFNPDLLFLSETLSHRNKLKIYVICMVSIFAFLLIVVEEETVLLYFGEPRLIVIL
jgi:hypothetical protein